MRGMGCCNQFPLWSSLFAWVTVLSRPSDCHRPIGVIGLVNLDRRKVLQSGRHLAWRIALASMHVVKGQPRSYQE